MPHIHIPDIGVNKLFLLLSDIVLFLAMVSITPSNAAEPLVDATVDSNRLRRLLKDAEQLENNGRLEEALSAYEDIYETVPLDDSTKLALRKHFAVLRPMVKPNTKANACGVWRMRVFVVKTLNFHWRQDGEEKSFKSSFTREEIRRIERSVKEFARYVSDFSDGWLRIEWKLAVVDKTLTSLDKIGNLYWAGPESVLPILPQIPVDSADSIVVFVETGAKEATSDANDSIPLYSFGAALGEQSPITRGAEYIALHWSPDAAISEPDGEPLLHEWLHNLQWELEEGAGYPEGLAGNPDGGRFVDEEREPDSTDPCYRRDSKFEKSWLNYYRHILQTHTTRKMLREVRGKNANKTRKASN